jgi:hypothetical protein
LGLRLYTKSGNMHYVDTSGFHLEPVITDLSESMAHGETVGFQGYHKVSVINCKEVEFFEVDMQFEEGAEEKWDDPDRIGFYMEDAPDETDEEIEGDYYE